MNLDTKSRVLSGLFWRYAERSGAQVIQFIVSVVLARMLTPADYGLVGLITVFIAVANVFAQSGLGQALVQKKDADDIDFSTVFYYNIIFSLILYAVLFFSAPLIADFYDQPQLISVIRVLGITVVINGINGVQQAYVQKTMQFKRFFCSTIIGTVSSAAVGLIMAYKGFGVWALVGQNVSNQVLNVIILWFTIEWKPILKFSFSRMTKLFSFGWKLLCSSLIDTIYGNVYSLVIGKFYSSSDLGYYNKGKSFPLLIINNINSAINSVLFPVMSEVQDDRERLKMMTRRSITISTYIIFPAMAGLAAIAEPMIVLLLTEKWLPAVPFVQFCCFSYAFWPVHTANLQAITALGRSDIFLKLEIIKKIIGIISLIISVPFGLHIMMIVRCINTIIMSVINAAPNKKLLGYSYIEQVKDMLPAILISVLMIICIIPVGLFPMNNLITIMLQVIFGIVFYFVVSKICKLDAFDYLVTNIKLFLAKNK